MSPLMIKEDLTVCQPYLPIPETWGTKKRRICFRYKRHPKLLLLGLALSCVCLIAWAHLYRLVTRHTDHSPEDADHGETSTAKSAVAKVAHELRKPDDQNGEKFRHDMIKRVRRSDHTSTSQTPENTTLCHKQAEDFPENFFNKHDTEKGGWILNLVISIYVFGCIAQVCDDYFVPSLEHFCEDLGLSPDVAGATFMAAGSSAPELATSLIGVFVAKSDVGVGAIVGSSIFNILVIVGAVGLLAGMPLHVSWYPLTRDVIFYIASVGIMVGSVADNHILWWEAFLMVLMYGCYILLMVFNSSIRQITRRGKLARKMSIGTMNMNRTSMVLALNIEARGRSRIANRDPMALKSVDQTLRELEYINKDTKNLTVDAIRKASAMRLSPRDSKVQVTFPKVTYNVEEEERNGIYDSSTDGPDFFATQTGDAEGAEESEGVMEEYTSPLTMPDGTLNRIYYFLYLPTTFLHAFTIPDSRIPGGWQARLYPLSFTLSVGYIAIYSYIMVWMALYAGSGIGIPDSVVGLTVLAAGTSVPDLMSSIYVARDGYGDMAVSNAIGSNIFDILVGLGLPWLINSLIHHHAATAMDNTGLFYTCITLFITALFVWILLLVCHWTLNKVAGCLALVAYVIIISMCILVEMNILFYFHKVCD